MNHHIWSMNHWLTHEAPIVYNNNPNLVFTWNCPAVFVKCWRGTSPILRPLFHYHGLFEWRCLSDVSTVLPSAWFTPLQMCRRLLHTHSFQVEPPAGAPALIEFALLRPGAWPSSCTLRCRLYRLQRQSVHTLAYTGAYRCKWSPIAPVVSVWERFSFRKWNPSFWSY